MNVNNYTNWNLIKYSGTLSTFILLIYFFWSINSWDLIKIISFVVLLLTFFNFFISKKFNEYWYVKIIIILLLIISLGSPTIPNDSRNLYLFSAKILFYGSNLYEILNTYDSSVNNFFGIVFAKPKLAATLSATSAKLIGHWNEIYPKSTNVILLFPSVLFLISFFSSRNIIALWLFSILFFSGKLFINGLMDGIIALYFTSSILVIYKISITNNLSEKKLLYLILFLFLTILSLTKYEGGIMLVTIIISSFLIDFIYEKKINLKIAFTVFLSSIPILFWKYIFFLKNIKMEFLQDGDPFTKVYSRVSNPEDVLSILSFLARNEKLLIALILFVLISFKYFNTNKKLIYLTVINVVLYFSVVIFAILMTPHTVTIQLEQSSTRVFIPIVLMLVYTSIFLIKDTKFFTNKNLE